MPTWTAVKFECALCDFKAGRYEPDWLDHLLLDSHQKRTQAASGHSIEANKKRSVAVFGIEGLSLKDVITHFGCKGIFVTDFLFWEEYPDICLIQFPISEYLIF